MKTRSSSHIFSKHCRFSSLLCVTELAVRSSHDVQIESDRQTPWTLSCDHSEYHLFVLSVPMKSMEPLTVHYDTAFLRYICIRIHHRAIGHSKFIGMTHNPHQIWYKAVYFESIRIHLHFTKIQTIGINQNDFTINLRIHR